MKNYRNTVAALVMALALLPSAYATNGIMHTGVAAPSPTPMVDSSAQTSDADGIMHTDKTEAGSEAADAVTVIALNLLQSVLTLF